MDKQEEKSWYYEKGGQRIGPETISRIKELIKNKEIDENTLAWKKGFEDWKKIKETELAKLFESATPPPLKGKNVVNVFAWLIAFSPIFGAFIYYLIALTFNDGEAFNEWIFWIILYSVFALLDYIFLKRAGYKDGVIGWAIIIVPVYLWKRANLTRQSKTYFWVLLAAIFISPFTNQIMLNEAIAVKKEVVENYKKVTYANKLTHEIENGKLFVRNKEGKEKRIRIEDNKFVVTKDEKYIYYGKETGKILESDSGEKYKGKTVVKLNTETLEEQEIKYFRKGRFGFISNLTSTKDKKYIFLRTNYWTVADALLRINTETDKVKLITNNIGFEIIKKGKFKDHLIVNKSHIGDSGRVWNYYLIDTEGKTIKTIGDSENLELLERFKKENGI